MPSAAFLTLMNPMASVPCRPLLVLAAALLPSVLAALPVSSTITAVTVYADRALVTRTATVDLPAGDQAVSFERLPAALDDDSLHVAGSSSVRATLGDVTSTPVFPERTPDDRVRALQDELKGEQRQLRVLNDEAAAVERERVLVGHMADAATQMTPGKDGTAPGRMQPAEMQQLLDFYGPALVKLAGEAQKLDDERDPLKEKIAATTAQLRQWGEPSGRSTKTVTVRVTMAAAGKLELKLNYVLAGARWAPSYEVRVTSGDHQVAFRYSGVVTQATGEDWPGVALTLSTARPAVGGAAPELAPWYVDQVQLETGSVLKNFRQRKAAAPLLAEGEALRAGANAMDAPEAFTVQAPDAAVAAGATSASFRIPGQVDVPSDNAPHQETVAQLSFAADLSYEATPKVTPAAFLSAAVTNSSDYPILAGPIAVFLDEIFVANSRTKTVMPTEKFNLALGVDEGIAVERKLLNRFTEDQGLITKQKRVTYDFLIKVANHRRDAVKLVLHDQIPVSRQEKIEVAQLEPSADKVKPDAQGLLTWTLELAPGEKQEIPLKFSVTYPTDVPISGLE